MATRTYKITRGIQGTKITAEPGDAIDAPVVVTVDPERVQSKQAFLLRLDELKNRVLRDGWS